MKELNRDGIKLSQLRALVAIAAHRNFSEAALSLEISQSAVSHAIATLEDELGVILLSRGRYGARPTPIGEKIIHHAQDVLGLLDTISQEADRSKGLEGGQVRIASFRSAATHILPAAIAQFRDRFPGISVTITEMRELSAAAQALREGQADIAFLHTPLPADLEVWELFRDEYLVLLPPNSLQPDEPLTWEKLLSFPFIFPPENDSCCELIRHHFAEHGYKVTPTYEVREDSTIVSMVMQGLGATVMAQLAAEPLPQAMEVRKLPVPLERVIGVALLADALHPPPVFAFLDTLKQLEQVAS